MRTGKHRRRTVFRRRWLRIALLTLVVIGLLFSGTAYAGFRYDQARADRILPGVTVGGLSVGGFTRAEAIEAVSRHVDRTLKRPIVVEAAGEQLSIAPGDLGTSTDVASAVDAALDVASEFSWTRRVMARLWNQGIGRAIALEYRHDTGAVAAWLEDVAAKRNVEPQSASVDWVDGALSLQPSRAGRALKPNVAAERVLAALQAGARSVTLPFRKLEPEVSEDALGHTIVVRTSINELYLFEGVDRVRTYHVATGTPGYPTPHGRFTIINKRMNPTWVNPAPDGWGRGLPRVVGPGPGNPLGTRALDIDAPGIRIHGTYADYSIGTAASHGCIRMHIPESEELFDLVDVGTPVIIVP